MIAAGFWWWDDALAVARTVALLDGVRTRVYFAGGKWRVAPALVRSEPCS